MPRVSQDHLDARRRQILDAAARCFLRRGFHNTTMQDVFGESGLSAGAVYRYFRSKDEIVAAIGTETLSTATALFETALATEPFPPLADVLGHALRFVEERARPGGELRIAIQVWGEAQHDPALLAIVQEKYGEVRGYLRQLVQRAQKDGQLDPTADPDQLAKVIFAVLQGFAVQKTLLGDVDADEFAAAARRLLRPPAEPAQQRSASPG